MTDFQLSKTVEQYYKKYKNTKSKLKVTQVGKDCFFEIDDIFEIIEISKPSK